MIFTHPPWNKEFNLITVFCGSLHRPHVHHMAQDGILSLGLALNKEFGGQHRNLDKRVIVYL